MSSGVLNGVAAQAQATSAQTVIPQAVLPPVSPIASTAGGAVRMFVAPVDRGGGGPRTFDPARMGRFDTAVPPAAWYALGAIAELERADESLFAEVWSGAPAVLSTRARSTSAAGVRCTFGAWSKLAMALASGSQQMNLLRTATIFAAANSGGTPAATAVMGGSTDTVLRVPAAFSVPVGSVVVVDEDYAGQTGYLGSPIANAFVTTAAQVNNDVHYLRRVSFNLGVVTAVAPDTTAGSTAQLITLAAPLPAGAPSATMQMSVVQGFQDRVGGSLLGEWSALFVVDGVAGDRILLHYPRLQVARGPNHGQSEKRTELASGLERWQLCAQFVALPVTDSVDGDAVLCYRSYLPAPGRTP